MSDFGGAIKDREEFDIAIIGIPYDDKSCYLKGAAEGPEAIRAASTGKAINPWTELGINLEEDVVMVDMGNVEVSGDFPKVAASIEKVILDILDKGAVPIVLGGDHSISYPVVKAFSRRYSPLSILHFDAHPDLYDELYGDRFSHACPFARIMEQGCADSLVQVGIRAATGEQRERALRHQIKMIDMKDIRKILKLDFSDHLYISFDMDALDPAFAPGVSHPEPGGLSTRQVIDILHALQGDIVGMDVVELNPDRDPSGITAAAAVKIIKEVAGKVAASQKKKGEEAS
jgi:agmatinase